MRSVPVRTQQNRGMMSICVGKTSCHCTASLCIYVILLRWPPTNNVVVTGVTVWLKESSVVLVVFQFFFGGKYIRETDLIQFLGKVRVNSFIYFLPLRMSGIRVMFKNDILSVLQVAFWYRQTCCVSIFSTHFDTIWVVSQCPFSRLNLPISLRCSRASRGEGEDDMGSETSSLLGGSSRDL